MEYMDKNYTVTPRSCQVRGLDLDHVGPVLPVNLGNILVIAFSSFMTQVNTSTLNVKHYREGQHRWMIRVETRLCSNTVHHYKIQRWCTRLGRMREQLSAKAQNETLCDLKQHFVFLLTASTLFQIASELSAQCFSPCWSN